MELVMNSLLKFTVVGMALAATQATNLLADEGTIKLGVVQPQSGDCA